jgi:hypothetical protein
MSRVSSHDPYGPSLELDHEGLVRLEVDRFVCQVAAFGRAGVQEDPPCARYANTRGSVAEPGDDREPVGSTKCSPAQTDSNPTSSAC